MYYYCNPECDVIIPTPVRFSTTCVVVGSLGRSPLLGWYTPTDRARSLCNGCRCRCRCALRPPPFALRPPPFARSGASRKNISTHKLYLTSDTSSLVRIHTSLIISRNALGGAIPARTARTNSSNQFHACQISSTRSPCTACAGLATAPVVIFEFQFESASAATASRPRL